MKNFKIQTACELDKDTLAKLSKSRDARIIEITTEAKTFWRSSSSSLTVPRAHLFWWTKTRENWTWHPQQGPCGPEGQGQANSKYVVPQAKSGGLTGWIPSYTEMKVCWYDPQFDASRGGTRAYLNDSGVDINYAFFCNDHNEEDMYADNSGLIIHTLTVVPR